MTRFRRSPSLSPLRESGTLKPSPVRRFTPRRRRPWSLPPKTRPQARHGGGHRVTTRFRVAAVSVDAIGVDRTADLGRAALGTPSCSELARGTPGKTVASHRVFPLKSSVRQGRRHRRQRHGRRRAAARYTDPGRAATLGRSGGKCLYSPQPVTEAASTPATPRVAR